jgi:short-subunit dehydrogenase
MKVFITGASSGIGEALARRYAKAGATLGLIARRAEALESLRSSLPAPTGAAHFTAALDVTDHQALFDAARAFMAQSGAPDVVIANAGISRGVSMAIAADLPVMEQIFATNVMATAATFTPFIDAMRERGSGRLVSIASVAGIRGLPGSSAYSASKAAVIAMTESLRVELRSSGIKVVTIAPGFIKTPMTAGNPYKMPFIMPVEAFADATFQAIEQGVSYRVIPWQMGLTAKVLRLLPNALYDLAFANAKQKPRDETP